MMPRVLAYLASGKSETVPSEHRYHVSSCHDEDTIDDSDLCMLPRHLLCAGVQAIEYSSTVLKDYDSTIGHKLSFGQQSMGLNAWRSRFRWQSEYDNRKTCHSLDDAELQQIVTLPSTILPRTLAMMASTIISRLTSPLATTT